MVGTGVTILEIALEHPDEETALLAWWDELRRLLDERFRLAAAELLVLERGRYAGLLGFRLPGIWKLVERDARWIALERARPASDVVIRQARRWHAGGNPRDITTAELARWIAERSAGRRDFVLLDTLGDESYARHHLPGALHLPVARLDAASAAAVVGMDRERPVVVYCAGHG